MKLTRRDFVHAGCTMAAASLVPESADAWTHGGGGGVGGSQSRVVINVPADGQRYLNLAKSFYFSLLPGSANQTSDGYPANGNLATSVNANISFPAGYYGKFFWGWTGTGAMESISGPIIVYSGGTAIFGIRPATSGDLSGNAIIAPDTGTAGITNPAVVFNYGWNIQSITNSGISNGSGGNLALLTVKSGFGDAGGFYTGTTVNITGTGTSQDGTTTTLTTRSATTFTLDGSTYVAGSGIAGTAVFALVSGSWAIYGAGQTFNNMTNLIVCKYQNATPDDYTNITANNQIYDTVLVNQLKYLMNSAGRGTPGWLRFMDINGGARVYESDFANRMPVTAMSYNPSRFVNNYWTGAIAWNSGDAYTCSDPTLSVWDSTNSRYFDGAAVQGTLSATNSGGNPTLAVGGHPAVPVFSPSFFPFIFRFSAAPASAGLTMQWTFTAAWLSGGAHTFTYTTVAGDVGNIATLNGNIQNAINNTGPSADPVLNAAAIQATNSGQLVIYRPAAAAGVLTITYSSGPAICTVIRIDPGLLTFFAGSNVTFIYNYLLGGFVSQISGMSSCVPLESIVDLCNRVGAHCWFNWNLTSGAYVTSTTNFFATNLTSGLKFGAETGNEIWNSTANPFVAYNTLGSMFGWNVLSGQASLGYAGLHIKQYAILSRAAWASAGRAASDHYVFSMGNGSDYQLTNNIPTFQWLGQPLDPASFPLYGSYGGLNGGTPPPTGSSSYHLAPNRPIDTSNAIGHAVYWGSPWLAGLLGTATGVLGTVAQNAPLLQASLDFTNGSTATAYTSLVNQFNGTTLRSDTTSGTPFGPDSPLFVAGFGFIASFITIFKAYEVMAATLDSAGHGIVPKIGIFHYEGGPNWAMGADGNNGVNSVNATDINALAAQFAALSWGSVAAYTHSGTDNKTELATQLITMGQAWKYDVSYKNLIKTSYYQAFYNVSGINREVHPGQYGYNASQWGLFPGSYSAGSQYTNYDAIHEWNA